MFFISQLSSLTSRNLRNKKKTQDEGINNQATDDNSMLSTSNNTTEATQAFSPSSNNLDQSCAQYAASINLIQEASVPKMPDILEGNSLYISPSTKQYIDIAFRKYDMVAKARHDQLLSTFNSILGNRSFHPPSNTTNLKSNIELPFNTKDNTKDIQSNKRPIQHNEGTQNKGKRVHYDNQEGNTSGISDQSAAITESNTGKTPIQISPEIHIAEDGNLFKQGE